MSKEKKYSCGCRWSYIALGVAGALAGANFGLFRHDMNAARNRLAAYDVQTVETTFGTLSYVDEGVGEPVLISHGIFGGYDQGFVTLDSLLGEGYRKIAPSRFGYPGSDLPAQPTPANQAVAFRELLDDLKIAKAYVLSTSAGGAAGIQFALKFPERTKGLILISSDAPDKKRAATEIAEMGMTGPPAAILGDFPMWFARKYFGFIFKDMFGSESGGNPVLKTMFPVGERRKGIITDTEITNKDMRLNYDAYRLEDIIVPVLVVHAKDDPMAKYANIQKLVRRIDQAETAIFDTGGHLIVGQATDVDVKKFITRTK